MEEGLSSLLPLAFWHSIKGRRDRSGLFPRTENQDSDSPILSFCKTKEWEMDQCWSKPAPCDDSPDIRSRM